MRGTDLWMATDMNKQRWILMPWRMAAMLALGVAACAAQAHGPHGHDHASHAGQAAAHAPQAHVHGLALLEVAVDGRTLSIALRSPLDSLLGFEHAPRTEAQRRAARALAERLADAARWLTVNPQAGCRAGQADLAPAWLAGGGHEASAADRQREHDDLDAVVEFTCDEPGRLAWIDVGLFGAFKGLRRIKAMAALPSGQLKQVLTPRRARLALGR